MIYYEKIHKTREHPKTHLCLDLPNVIYVARKPTETLLTHTTAKPFIRVSINKAAASWL